MPLEIPPPSQEKPCSYASSSLPLNEAREGFFLSIYLARLLNHMAKTTRIHLLNDFLGMLERPWPGYMVSKMATMCVGPKCCQMQTHMNDFLSLNSLSTFDRSLIL